MTLKILMCSMKDINTSCQINFTTQMLMQCKWPRLVTIWAQLTLYSDLLLLLLRVGQNSRIKGWECLLLNSRLRWIHSNKCHHRSQFQLDQEVSIQQALMVIQVMVLTFLSIQSQLILGKAWSIEVPNQVALIHQHFKAFQDHHQEEIIATNLFLSIRHQSLILTRCKIRAQLSFTDHYKHKI
jgi:hypothetical protein